jgi:hypothetical protein
MANEIVPVPSDAIVSDVSVDDLVQELVAMYGETGIRLAVEMGHLIIERLYEGDLIKWRSRGRKDTSFRKLERHPALPFRKSTLSRAVSIYMLYRRRNDVLSFRHLSPSHLHEVSGLAETVQDSLLQQAEAERWSVQKVRAEARLLLGVGQSQRKIPEFVRSLRRLEGEIGARCLLTQIDMVEQLPLEDAARFLDTLKTMLQQGEILVRRLSNRVNTGGKPQADTGCVAATVPTSGHSSRRRSGIA